MNLDSEYKRLYSTSLFSAGAERRRKESGGRTGGSGLY
jgi:hypothetical protein